MAHGPCGQQFREAFSCFVYSEADPKGIDCVEKFKAMQDCFREHPDVYGDGMWILTVRVYRYIIIFAAEIMDDEEESPTNSLTTETTDGDLHPLDNLPPETTEQSPTSASS